MNGNGPGEDLGAWIDLCYRYDGGQPLSLLQMELLARMYASLRGPWQSIVLFTASDDGDRIEGGLWVDARGTTIVDVFIDLLQDQPGDMYDGLLEACRDQIHQLRVRSDAGTSVQHWPLVSGGRLMGCLTLEQAEQDVPLLGQERLSQIALTLAGGLRYAQLVRAAFLERRYLVCSVNMHQQYKSELSPDHILNAVCFHIQTTLELDRCLIIGETDRGWRRYCSGLTYVDEGPKIVDPEPWLASTPYEEKIAGSVAIFPLPTRNGRSARIVFDNSISQTRFSDRDLQQLAMVRDTLAVLWAFTEDLEAERSQASFDSLTGAWNRAYGVRFIDEWLNNLRFSQDSFALMFVDVDRFKAINDGYGHAIGDRTLTAIAEQLIRAVGERGAVIRYGGEEFLVACPKMNRIDAERMASVLTGSFDWPEDLPRATVSVGLAMGPIHGEHCSHLIDSADQAMYRAKRSGGNGWQWAGVKASEQ